MPRGFTIGNSNLFSGKQKYLRKGFFSFVLFFVIVVFYSHSKNTKGMFFSFLEMKLIFSALNI